MDKRGIAAVKRTIGMAARIMAQDAAAQHLLRSEEAERFRIAIKTWERKRISRAIEWWRERGLMKNVIKPDFDKWPVSQLLMIAAADEHLAACDRARDEAVAKAEATKAKQREGNAK